MPQVSSGWRTNTKNMVVTCESFYFHHLQRQFSTKLWNSKPHKQSMVSNDSNGNFWELSKICIICINLPSVTTWKIIPTHKLIHLFIKIKYISFLVSSTYIKIKNKMLLELKFNVIFIFFSLCGFINTISSY